MSSFAPRHPSEERSASCHTPELPINASSSSRPPPTSPIHLPSYARDQSISSNPPSGHRPRNTPPTSYGAPSHHMIGHDPLFNSSASVPLSPSRKLDQPTQARSSSEVHLALQASQSGSRPLATSSASLYAPPTAPTANGRHGDLSSRLGPISSMPPPLYLSSSPANQENASGTSRPQDEEGIGSGRYGERRLSATEKGKGRASDLSMDPDSSGFLHFEDESSRSKRVRKKRRLSAAGEIDPNDLNDDGSLAKKPRPKPNGHVQELPLTAGDRAYFARIEQTALRPPLSDMKGPCPVWAKTRHALQSAAEYLRQPVKTVGASVGIGAGGVARGVILEGQAPGQAVFWGRGKQAGTIVTSIGASRPIFHPDFRDNTDRRDHQNHLSVGSTINGGLVESVSDPSTIASGRVEAPEIAALLKAQRTCSPIAIAVAQDYSSAPFKVPRPFVVLGWFWVVDAWVEPDFKDLDLLAEPQIPPRAAPTIINWKFRFEWCDRDQSTPWWSSVSEPDRVPAPPVVTDEKHACNVAGPGIHGATTVQRNSEPIRPPAEKDTKSNHEIHCPHCSATSEKVYAKGNLCLNESCPWFFVDVSRREEEMRLSGDISTYPIGPPDKSPSQLRPLVRVDSTALSLHLRPPEPAGDFHQANSNQAGRDFWRGWVCHSCGMANERKKWKEWDCDACGHVVCPRRHIYDDTQLRSPIRPICTGPRHEDGFPNWPFRVTRSWTLFADDIKVVKYGLEAAFGNGAEVYHALNSEGKTAHAAARSIFKVLQAQGPPEIPFKRHIQPTGACRPADAYLAPFYTYLCGGADAPDFEAFPSDPAVHWSRSPQQCLDAADLINERAARMFSGEKERFNSLLIAAYPPQLATSLQPHVIVTPNSYAAFLYLGSDGTMRFQRKSFASGARMKQGELTIQHGDVVGVRTGSEAIELLPTLDGFGFVCIARQAYRLTKEEYQDSHRNMSPEFRSTSGFVLSASKAARPRAPAVARLPPKPAKLSVVPLTDWYIGPRPLDTQQPLRVFSALTDQGRTLKADDRVSPVPNPLDYTLENDITAEPEATVDPISSGTVVLSVTPAAPTVHAPPPSSPTPRKKKLDNVDSPVKAKNSKTKRVSEDIPKDRTSFTSVYDAGSIGTPITVDHLESQAACKAR